MKRERTSLDFNSLEQFLMNIQPYDPSFAFIGSHDGALYHVDVNETHYLIDI